MINKELKFKYNPESIYKIKIRFISKRDFMDFRA